MARTRPASSRLAFPAVALLVVGLGLWALFRFSIGSERHSYAPDAIAPSYVTVTTGHTYRIAIPGGVSEEQRLGLDPSALRCNGTQAGTSITGLLHITAEPTGSKATDQIASFVAPVSGPVHIDCTGLPPVFVDNAEDAAYDRSGLWLVLGTIALAIGVPLMLSVLRRPSSVEPVEGDPFDDAAPEPPDGAVGQPVGWASTTRSNDSST